MAKLILELGINHDGNFQIAKKLVNQAKEIGCWGIKFQYRDLSRYLKKKSKRTELGKEIVDHEIKKNFLSEKQIVQLTIYAKKLGLKCGISFFSEIDVNNFPKKLFDFYKIPSPVSDNYKLIKRLKNIKKKLIISFGGKNYNTLCIKLTNAKKIMVVYLIFAIAFELFPEYSLYSLLSSLAKKNL